MAKKPGKILGQPSWQLPSDNVTAFLTEKGGHLTATFKLGDREIQPLHVAPWAEEPAIEPPIIQALRGDFFCMPFGTNERAYGDEQHPVHGETANDAWKEVDGGWEIKTKIRLSKVRKEIALRDTAIYQRHTVSGGSGPMCFGHHAMLAFPSEGLVSTSRFPYGIVFPGEFESPARGGYSSLKPGGRFSRLEVVPMTNGSVADLSRYPAREGFEDLVMLVGDDALPFAWNAVVFPAEGYVWFSLRNPRVLRHTILWHSNGGRHYAPWNGRHRRVLGIEDVTAYFHHGLAESAAPNSLSEEGIPTSMDLDPSSPLVVSTIMGVAAVGANAEHVETIEPRRDGIDIVFADGTSTFTPIDLAWIGN